VKKWDKWDIRQIDYETYYMDEMEDGKYYLAEEVDKDYKVLMDVLKEAGIKIKRTKDGIRWHK